jgi:hypothetical protein
LSDSQRLSAVFEGIEMITNIIARYGIFEELYLQETSKASDLLGQSIIKLYASVLTYLAQVKRYYAQNTASMSRIIYPRPSRTSLDANFWYIGRIMNSVLQITDHDVEKLTEDIRGEQDVIDDLARMVDAECG